MPTGRAFSIATSSPPILLLDNQGTVWVTDFGLAKATADGEDLTHTGDILGTLRYMAPERFQGRSDARCDIYSLGLTLYEMLVQRPGFDETDRNKLIHQVTHDEPPRPRKLNPAIPRDLETLVLKAIEREAAQRYQSARAFGEDLKRFMEDKPILARPVSSGERLVRWCRRNPALAGLAAGITALLILGCVASTVAALRFSALARQEHTARQEAEEAQRTAEANLAKARAAVDYFTGVAENDLLKVPGALSLRRQVLRQAKTYYEDFLKDRGNDPALQAELAAAYLRLARIGNDLGQYDEAAESLNKAIAGYNNAIANKSSAANPSQLQEGLADTLQAVGDFNSARVPKTAIGPYQQATNIRRGLAQAHPNNPEYKEKLATMYNRLGIAQIANDRQAEAFESYRKCVEIRLELIRDNASSPTLQYGMGESFLNLAQMLSQRGHQPEALALFLRSRDFYRAACAQMPHMAEYAMDLGSTYSETGNILWNLGQRELAIEQYQQGAEHFLARLRAHPDVQTYRYGLFSQVGLHSASLRQMGRKEDALGVLRQACQAFSEVPDPTGDDLYLLAILERQTAALTGFGKKELTPDERAQEHREMDQVTVTMRRALAAGYHSDWIKNDLNRFKNDPNSKGLLERNKDWLAAVEKEIQNSSAKRNVNELAAKKPTKAVKDPAGNLAAEASKGLNLTKADLARSRLAIGLLMADHGQNQESEKALSEAMAMRQELAKSDPKNTRYQRDLASASVAQGHAAWRAGRLGDAVHDWQKGLDLLVSLDRESGGKHDTSGKSDNLSITAQVASIELAIGNHYGEIGLWSEASEHYSKVFAKNLPGEALAWAYFAPLLLLTGDQAGYRRHCSQMLLQFGNTPDVQKILEVIYGGLLGQTDAGETNRWLQLAEKSSGPKPEWGKWRLANAQYRAGRFKEALSSLDQVPNLIERWPLRALVLHRLGQTEAARQSMTKADNHSKELIQQALARDSLRVPWETWWRNWAAFQILRREAHELIDGSPMPDDPWQRLLRARAYLKLGQHEKADKDLEAAVAYNPKDFEIWWARAGLFAQLSQADKAVQDFVTALDLVPAAAYPDRMFFVPAVPQESDIFARLVKLRPDARLWMGRVHRLGRRGQWKNASAAIAKVIELNPNDHRAWYYDSVLRLEAGDVEGYRRDCREMLTRFGHTDNPAIAERTAKTCLLFPDAVDNLEPVVQLAKRALTINPNHPDMKWFYLARGMADYRLGQYEGAQEWLQKALSSDEEDGIRDSTVYLFLAMAHHRLGKTEEARLAERALGIIDRNVPKIESGDLSDSWDDWLRFQINRREAEALLRANRAIEKPMGVGQ
jgi:tetratricopeptide (TPR) repeat protein